MNNFLEYMTLEQVVGVMASAFIVGGYFCKSDNKAKAIIICGSVLFAVHFFMIGAMTAALMNVVNFFRVGLSIKFHGSKILFTFFVSVYLISLFFTYEEWLNILPVISSVLGCIGMYFLSGIKFRLCTIVGSSCWLLHNALVGSVGGVITEIFVLTAALTTIYRLWLDQKKAEVK